ncbi:MULTISPECIES: GTP 3',8-cyclase MoaA [Thermoactinomyces]|uniref:GTP 3',8-cyclase MoaA n=1 Tax=Thermoactinomyces TaxID=2023 RepID=UPI000519FFF9|nr:MULTISPECIES: GTP 3',8-cyclase MoaA [Thermoactinomyces]
MKPIVDSLGRPLRDLRISVTDRCNFRCRYCMPEELFGSGFSFLPKEKLLTFEEIVRLAHIFTELGVSKIRITGGEPLLRQGIVHLIEMLADIKPLQDLAMTTNGVLLTKFAAPLKQAGLKRINVSLDTLRDDTFHRLNSRNYSVRDVLQGIEAAQKAGLSVKVNMVVIKGVNDTEIVEVARYFRERELVVRFIEFMDVGNSNGWNADQVISKQEIISRIHAEMPLEAINPAYFGEVATRYRYQGTETEVGMIPSITQPFCSSCTRLRLSSDGFLYTCLFATEGFNLRDFMRQGADDEKLRRFIEKLWAKRADRYSEERFLTGDGKNRKKIEMSYIGG